MILEQKSGPGIDFLLHRRRQLVDIGANGSFAEGSKEMKCRVLIADDHGVVRKGLRLLLEQHPELVVVGEASNGREAATMAAALSPQIVVMDVAMPILNGIEAAEQILKDNSETGIIMLTMHALNRELCPEGAACGS